MNDKLQEYLEQNGYDVERIDRMPSKELLKLYRLAGIKAKGVGEFHQVNVYIINDLGERVCLFDAICHYGSYGFNEGLLEVMSSYLVNNDNYIEGHLTAKEIINRLEALS